MSAIYFNYPLLAGWLGRPDYYTSDEDNTQQRWWRLHDQKILFNVMETTTVLAFGVSHHLLT